MPRNPTWRYHAAKRRQEQKLRDFATMYGPKPSPDWASTPTSRVTIDLESRPSPLWQALNGMKPSAVFTDEFTHADFSAIEARILATMSMSRDRVRFNLAPYGADQPTRDAFHKAFGAPFPFRSAGEIVTIVCRPSQFARFMIYRNDFGGRNSFKELAPVLFTPEAQKSEIDVSGNPAS